MFHKLTVSIALAASFALTAHAADPGRHYVEAPAPASGPALPFSEAVTVGDTVYIAGHLGQDPKTMKIPESAEAESRFVLDAIKHTVEAAGLHMDDLVSVTVYCTDLTLYDTFNGVYRTYFHDHFPARAFIGVAQLVRGARIEVSAIAVKPAH
jgi:2-iminobutanoate/2-iminopropanoate deaminase